MTEVTEDKDAISVEDIEVITGVLEDAKSILNTIERCSGMLETISTLQERLWNAFTNLNWVLSPTLLALLLLNTIGSLYDGHKIPLFIAIFFRVIVALLFSVSIVNIPSYYMAILAVLCISDEYLETYENLVHCELDGDESTISDECQGNYDWIQGLDTSDDEARDTGGIKDLDEARKKV